MVDKRVKVGLIVVTFLVFATVIVFPLDSGEVDELCDVEGSFLKRVGGEWVCAGVFDTNESVRVGNAVGDCGAGDYLYGFYANLTKKCRADVQGGGGSGQWSISGSDWLFNDSGVLDWNVTKGDARYVLPGEFDNGSVVRNGDEGRVLVDWDNLTGVPAGFADGTDNEGDDTNCADVGECPNVLYVGMVNDTDTNCSVEGSCPLIMYDSEYVPGSGQSYFWNQTPLQYSGDLDNGSMSGYEAGNAICNLTFVGSHFCSEEELFATLRDKDVGSLAGWNGYPWVMAGGTKYVPASKPANDCNGWDDGTSNYIGNIWNMEDDMGQASQCDSERNLTCCRVW